MGVNFSPFEIGRRALHAAQFGITVTGQNIANVNTPGYSRQSVMLAATAADGANLKLVGSGVTIQGVQQFRDRFVDSRLQTETAISGRLTAQRDALSPVDEAFNESNGNGLSAAIDGFFGAFQALESNPNSFPLRTGVVSKANSLAAAFAAATSRLSGIRSDADKEIRTEVDHLNQLTKQVADLNVRISTAEHSASSASELRDQRGEVVRQIAELTGARAVEDQDGMVTLTLADGQPLVSGNTATPLSIQDTPPDGLAAIVINGQPAAIADGKLKGLEDAIAFVNSQMTSLDDLAASITARVNTLHTSGADRTGNPGGVFFAVPITGPVTAANFAVATSIKSDPNLIVASPMAPPSPYATVAGAIGALLNDPNSTAGVRAGSFSSIYGSIVSDAGKSVQSLNDALTTQQAILSQAQTQRDAVSGVSLDEEAINMLQFQKSYEAAARFLKIADEMTQTILSLGA
jgi:flagellar hook-associated protein 1 FlgK